MDYVFETPVEMDTHTLIFIAHFWEGEMSPAWMYDETDLGSGDWDYYDKCRSALNMPGSRGETTTMTDLTI